jgi:hypothetical protein
MAERSPTIPPFPLPTDAQASALPIAGVDPCCVGIQTATALLGCPPLHGETTLLARIANSLLTGAGLVELSDLVAET